MKGNRVTLRKVHEGDIDTRQRLGRHPEIAKGFGVNIQASETITYDEAKAWVGEVAAQETAWIIEYEKRLIGLVRLDEIKLDDLRCSLAIGIFDPAVLGIGLGEETIKLCVTLCF